MNSRERVTRAIEMTGPDRVPITHATLPGAAARYGSGLADLHERFPSDVLSVGGATSGELGPEIGKPSRDTWGSLWVRYTDEHKGQIVHNPLADWEALDTFVPPDTASDAILAQIQENLDRNAGELYTVADGDILWQRMFYLHGYQAILEDLLIRPDRSAALRDMILDVMQRRIERLCDLAALDGIAFRDDWGTQLALMISPSLWREFFGPAYGGLFRMARDVGKHVWFHSDGAINAIVPDLIEMGVQVFNPQVDALGVESAVALCAGKTCIQGDIDRQWTLPFGSSDDVRAAVRRDIDRFGRFDGGYIARAEAAGDVPLENMVAVYEEAVAYGTYGA